VERKRRYCSIKVPEVTYEAAQIARMQLIKKGVDVLPKHILQPEKCPLCNGKIEKFEARYSYYECKNCGYKQQAFEVKANTFPTLGDVIGLGITFLTFLGLTAVGIKLINDLFNEERKK